MSDISENRSIYLLGGRDGSASVEFFLSLNEMEVTADFKPPHSNGKMLIYSDVEDSLQSLGIVHGIQTRAIQDAIYRCNMEQRTLTGVVIAKGTPPLSQRPAYLKLEERLYKQAFQPQVDPLKVDYKTFSPFVIVKKGELLARAVKPRDGVSGTTVKGDIIAFSTKDIKFLKPGENTLYVRGQVFSRCAGRFYMDKDLFHISDTLELPEGVNYSTGHILFPGHLQIGGQVQPGFRVISGGNIECKSILDASEVMTKGSLLCHGGIIGRKPGVVRAGGSISAVFAENVQMEALSDIKISKTVLNSRIFSNGSFTMDEQGKIVASQIFSRGTLTCHQLGNDSSHTHVVLGRDFVIYRRLEHLRIQFQEEEDQLVKIKSRLEQVHADGWEKTEAEMKDRIQKIVDEINTLQDKLINPEPFELRVKGDVYPGCIIEMGWARMDLLHLQSGGKVFRLSDDRKTILVEKMQS